MPTPATILWRRLDLPGHELARLAPREDGWELSGTALFVHQRRPCRLHYRVACDAEWRTRALAVEGSIGPREVDLNVTVDAEGCWRLNGAERPAVAGCLDVDLGFSPATNLLPIRRLSLAVGQKAEVQAAWMPFPSLEFEPLSQVYRRESERIYRYASGGGRFVSELEVDPSGFVLVYPGLWQAEASKSENR